LATEATLEVALAIHDTIYLNNFSVTSIQLNKGTVHQDKLIADHIIVEIEKYEHKNFAKFIGAGLPTTLQKMSPSLCSRLWLDLDAIPIVLKPDREQQGSKFWDVKQVDEQADSMARKCIMYGKSTTKRSIVRDNY
jgi:alpha,alpha-trehalose phosphorylase (configuration-retaining)